ncbi:MAG: hypothetical protein PUB07_05320 [Clostridia bacterium]|nr:hypothetical protein [Clostridia bacterium]
MKKQKYIFMKAEDSFSPDAFKNPDVLYAPVYVWCWNAEVSEEETIKQLDEMQRLGIRAMYILPEPKSFRPSLIPTRLEPDYLTPAYFEAFLFATREAEKRGMNMWLYDEGGWPSGGACGRVLMEHPEYARKSLASRKKTYAAGKIYEMAEDTVIAFLKNGRSVENGNVFKEEENVTEYYIKTTLFERISVPDFPDLTRKEATEAFIELGLSPYLPYIGDTFGKSVTAVFTDEPTMPRPVPLREELMAQFEAENGYSIAPYLPELLDEKEVTSEGAEARISWFDMCSRMFCENFILQEKKWVNKQGVPFLGHMDGDDAAYKCISAGNAHILRALRLFDVPGVDVIWRQIYPLENPTPFDHTVGVTAENRIFPRYASSAAAQIGGRRAMTESCGVYGAGMTFDEMRFVMNFQAIRGINVFNLFSVPYGRRGFQMTGEMPFFTEKHACYKDLATFNAYLERLSYVTSIGKTENNTALYMPMCDFWAGENTVGYGEQFEKTGKDLEDLGIPFDVFDDDVLEAANKDALFCGEIRLGDARYTTLVIPPCKYMPTCSIEKLEIFISGGGRVILLSSPDMPVIRGAEITDTLSGKLVSPLVITEPDNFLRIGVRAYDEGRIYFIHNERESETDFGVELCENVYRLDLNTGEIFRPNVQNGEIKLCLASGEMAVLLCTENAVPFLDSTVFTKQTEISNSFVFRRTERFSVGEMDYILEDVAERDAEIPLGDWSERVGLDFSGSGIYTVSFDAPKTEGKICIDLGDVHYTCEAVLNGESLGKRVMAPYTYVVSADELKKKNKLEIRVTNTGANAYVYTKSFEKWQEWQLPYMPKQKVFHTDSISGGLYGPVKILY